MAVDRAAGARTSVSGHQRKGVKKGSSRQLGLQRPGRAGRLGDAEWVAADMHGERVVWAP